MLFDYMTVSPESITADVDRILARANTLVEEVAGSADAPTYDSVLGRLEDVSDMTASLFGRTGFMGYVHPDEAIRTTGQQLEERISKWGIEITFRPDLYAAVKAFAESDEARTLTGEKARLLEFTLRDFRKAGHELSESDQARLKELSNRLVELGTQFQKNIADVDDTLVVTRDDLEGMPDWYADSLEPTEDGEGLQITMAYPHVVPFVQNASRRDLREALMFKFNNRAREINRVILAEAVDIRQEIAELFDKESWAHHLLDERMAENPENVFEFYDSLREPLQAAAREEIARMTELLRRDTSDESAELQAYDWQYYDTLLRKTEYGVDPNEVAQYFELGQVLEGMFEITGDVFGLTYERVEAPTWHPEVITYAIHDASTGDLISHFYMDLFPREAKFSHAAAFPLVPGRRLADGSYQHPVSAIVANVTKPTEERPSLLQHQEVETMFHEFGHILHQTLTKAELVRFSGTSVERDFVEAPSQIMEHWTWKPDVLQRFARHHETAEPIPEDLVDKLVAAKNLNIALMKLRQMTYGTLDMNLHGPNSDRDLDRALRDANTVSLLPTHEGTFFPASFGHLFGYDAGYYGYLWSEVYGDDMWSRFEQEGYTSPEVGADYRREILEAGGARDGMDHLRAFLGREPDNTAFLVNIGIET
ncbi:MAG: Zn-dependent oligopeptidase [Acidimicrobiia bacterium]|nr:Zn-dependent oligopeptidase [Acidimicrobiia bacterium]